MSSTGGRTTGRVALFLFAHQDDEFGVFQAILNETENGNRAVCVYLTDGGKLGASTSERNEESLAVLQQLGVRKDDVHFIGSEQSIPDGSLIEKLPEAAVWLKEYFNSQENVIAVYVPAWEGGHHDHDAINALAVTLAASYGMLNMVRQFPLYTGYGCAGPLFRVLSPLPMNGTVSQTAISWRNRLRFLLFCLYYRSQTRSWLGLFPFVAFHYLVVGTQFFQSVSVDRIRQRPHEGTLYYEKRRFYSWEKMSAQLSLWRTLNHHQ